ncbi:4-alpha-glucanotransferase [Halanaerobacter jeridensis]|uniref:4-alpha-glucanotransferase n=1 Tax=Halanaerobacter jeridensis TaxID=706427 RepID=A0A938XVD5_9FIRM|nr:4-alpha-glucanotransferase [Halanaerobacter jeridensis]MBM7555930.1 4-alpha-glucanotransferase [Halanaerobacter jeridensis]
MKFKRNSGVFLHPTSLPGKYGIGSLGEEAYEFIDFLNEAGQKVWQMCPLGPTGYGDSPYQCFSAFAGNPYLIDLEKLLAEGYLVQDDLEEEIDFPTDRVDYGQVIDFKMPLLRKAFNNFKKSATEKEKEDFADFCAENADWLDDYALFRAIKEKFGGVAWTEWDDDIRFREEEALKKYRAESEEKIEFRKFLQYIFFQQWAEVKEYANQKGIKILGDIPIFVAMDSADAWANPEMFFFDEDLKPTKVAGVPPDYFNENGQLWGNPLYKWDKLQKNNYQWWVKRVEKQLDLVDIIRLDHFRGFSQYWAVPYGAETAINGEWEDGPGKELFKVIKSELGELPIVAEDLGVVTDDVEELRDHFNFPGMKILQFAFDNQEQNDYLPPYEDENCIVYTGTHDNNTTLGWYEEDLVAEDETDMLKFLDENLEVRHDDIVWDLIELGWQSKAVMAIAPLQDFLTLGSEARFNTPGTSSGNWQWRYTKDMIDENLIERIKGVTERNDRV